MGHYKSFSGRGFFIAWLFYRFSGVQRDPSRFTKYRSVHFGTPENRHYDDFLHLSRKSCRHIIQGRTPRSFAVKLNQLVLEFSCSRQTRPQNAIFILKSSSLRFHRGTAKFIALIGKTSRRFNELDPEILHRYSMGHNKKTYGGGFLIFFIFDLEGSEYTAFSQKDLGPRKNGEKGQKIKKPSPFVFL